MKRTEEEIIEYLKTEHLPLCIEKENELIEFYGLLKYETVLAERIEVIEQYKKKNPELTLEDVVLIINGVLEKKWEDGKIDETTFGDNAVLNITASLKIRGLMK